MDEFEQRPMASTTPTAESAAVDVVRQVQLLSEEVGKLRDRLTPLLRPEIPRAAPAAPMPAPMPGPGPISGGPLPWAGAPARSPLQVKLSETRRAVEDMIGEVKELTGRVDL